MRTITFYSYKGGVGRSLALSNIAERLSELKKTVCVIDFDLEAPGLHFKFKNYNNSSKIQQGLVDYIFDFTSENNLHGSIKNYIHMLYPDNKVYSPIHFIPAGNIDSQTYWKKLSKIRWADLFYEKDSPGLSFFLDLKRKIIDEINPDFLLIDSRTGITDISGITLKILADEVVILSAYNEESLYGSKKIIKNLYDTQNSLFNQSLNVNFVLSRIPFSNDKKDRNKEANMTFRVKRIFEKYLKVNDFKINIIHSDRRLEENEKHLIGYEYTKDTISISNDYLKLFDVLTNGWLNEEEKNALANLKKAELEFKKAIKEESLIEKLRYLENAIELDNSNHEYFHEIGHVYFKLKKLEESIESFNSAKELSPNKSTIYYSLSVAYYTSNDIEQALNKIDKAINLDPRNSDYYILRSLLLSKLRRFEESLKVLDKALRQEPENDRLLNVRADLHRKLGNYDKAFKDIYKAIEIDSEEPLYFGTLAEIFGVQNKVNEFYLNLSIALSRGITSKDLNSAKEVYENFKNEKRLIKLLEKNNIEIEEILEG